MSKFAVIASFMKKRRGKDRDIAEILKRIIMVLKGIEQTREQTAVSQRRKRNETQRTTNKPPKELGRSL